MPHQCTTCGETFPDGSKEMLAGCPSCDGNKFQFLPGTGGEKSPDLTEDSGVDEIVEAPEPVDPEDAAQASARRTIVKKDELPARTIPEVHDQEPDETVDEVPEPDLNEIQAELNQQFESIKILKPGQYELNLMELYDRDEFIVALEEDGRYAINVPSSLSDSDEQ